MYASVYSEMKPQPTRRAPDGSGSGAASAALPAGRATRAGMVILKGMVTHLAG
jgi:hypothetical protein